jgi:uncharacterized protein (DUF2126 family)
MKRQVEVTFVVNVEVDETKFTPEWIEDWQKVFYPFNTIDDHLEHIAQMEARDILNPKFTEGYGPLTDMGIKASVVSQSAEVLSP